MCTMASIGFHNFTPLYEVVDEDDSQKRIHIFSSPTGIFAIFTIENQIEGHVNYVLKDHQGSLAALVNEKSGTEYFSFDAWGRRRNAQTWTYTNMPISFGTTRGFTMHDHLDEFNLINMNGRMYDPVVSRMLSPDNFVQAPDFSQSFNRYSYVTNNPLRYTDPSGNSYIETVKDWYSFEGGSFWYRGSHYNYNSENGTFSNNSGHNIGG